MLSLGAAIAGFVATSVVAAAGTAGYLVGVGEAPSLTDAAHARALAAVEAEEDARGAARERAFDEAALTGRAKGRTEGERIGSDEGSGAAGEEINEQQPVAAGAVPSPSTDPYDYDLSTTAEPVNGECPPPLTYHMGICKLSRPALPEECPPGWVPAGVTGACGPGRP